jgi:hypothetical protein
MAATKTTPTEPREITRERARLCRLLSFAHRAGEAHDNKPTPANHEKLAKAMTNLTAAWGGFCALPGIDPATGNVIV